MTDSAAADSAAADSAATYARRGFCVVENVLTAAELALLRREADALRSQTSVQDLCDENCVLEALPSGMPDGSAARTSWDAYLARRAAAPADRVILQNLLERKLAGVLRATLNTDAVYLFNEHFVVKPPGAGRFAWHTDAAHQLEAVLALGGGDAGDALAEYASAWVALDDVDASNGQLLLLPWDAPQPPGARPLEPAGAAALSWLESAEAAAHVVRPTARAGDAVVFAATLWHASEPNASSADRRAYYAQYSRSPIATPCGGPLHLALPAPAPKKRPRADADSPT